MSWPHFSWYVVGIVAERAELVNVRAELVNVRAEVVNVQAEVANVLAEVVNVRAEVVNVRVLPISCLVAIRSGNSSPMTLIMISWFEPLNANSETMKSNHYFSNSCFAFTLYLASVGLQMVVCQ